MVLTVSFGLSPVIGLSCHRHLARLLARLDAGVEASGPHDFAVRAGTVRLTVLLASTASRPALMTLRNAPPKGQDGGRYGSDLGGLRSRIFLQLGLDRANQIDPLQEIKFYAKLRSVARSERSPDESR
jgi:hypothetical protein